MITTGKVLLFLYVAGFSVTPLLSAKTITVNSLFDEIVEDGQITLREAISQAQPNDHIAFAATILPGTITLQYDAQNQGALIIDKPLVIDGPGQNRLPINGGGVSRVFFVKNGGTLQLNDVTLANAYAKGGNGGNGDLGGGGGAGYGDRGRWLAFDPHWRNLVEPE